jgi:acetyltransferase-like isoleucine patch superfamily enzyme
MANFFHETVSIASMVSIDVSSRGTHTYIGAYSVIDDFVKIKHVGGNGDIRMGEYVYLNSGTVLYSGNGITMGSHILVGPNCNLVPVNHAYSQKDKLMRLQGFKSSKGGIVIEDDVWLGANVTLLDGAHIKKGCVIGAGSVVKEVTEEYGIYTGNPLKLIAYRDK